MGWDGPLGAGGEPVGEEARDHWTENKQILPCARCRARPTLKDARCRARPTLKDVACAGDGRGGVRWL